MPWPGEKQLPYCNFTISCSLGIFSNSIGFGFWVLFFILGNDSTYNLVVGKQY